MKNKTCEDAADAIVTHGGGRSLIVRTMQTVFKQAYSWGYNRRISDMRRIKEIRRSVMDRSFKQEMDTIDDVIKSKWA